MYDVTDDTSANELKTKWYPFVERKKQSGEENAPIYFVIGTKTDENNQTVSIETMKQKFRNEPIKEFFEVSSFDMDDNKVFERCIENIIQTILLRLEGVVPKPFDHSKKKSKCCPKMA